jgi:acetolactate synthase-1/2/3 large subunit
MINHESPCVLEVFMNPEQNFIPKVKGVLMPDKSILSLPIEEMSPLLSLDEVEENMLIEVSAKSKEVNR